MGFDAGTQVHDSVVPFAVTMKVALGDKLPDT